MTPSPSPFSRWWVPRTPTPTDKRDVALACSSKGHDGRRLSKTGWARLSAARCRPRALCRAAERRAQSPPSITRSSDEIGPRNGPTKCLTMRATPARYAHRGVQWADWGARQLSWPRQQAVSTSSPPRRERGRRRYHADDREAAELPRPGSWTSPAHDQAPAWLHEARATAPNPPLSISVSIPETPAGSLILGHERG